MELTGNATKTVNQKSAINMPCQTYERLVNPEVFDATSDDGSIIITPGGLRGHRPDFSVNPDVLAVSSVSNTSLVNTLSTTVNAITGTGVTIINSNSLTAGGSAIISSVNGVSSILTPSVGTISLALGFDGGGNLVKGAISNNDANAQMFTDSTSTQITNATSITESAQIRRSGVTVLGSTAVGVTDANAKLKVVGNIELDASTSTTGNLTKGGSAFLHNYGVNSVFLGQSTGNFTLTGSSNTGIGAAVLPALSSGLNNTGVGVNALVLVNSGSQNTSVGVISGGSITTGSNNSFFGYASGNKNTASDNTAIGDNSAYYNITGTPNTSIGRYSMYNNIASNNLGIGYSALGNITNTNAGSFVVGTTYRIFSAGTTNFTLIGSANNTAGTYFVASGAGTGNGTALAMVTGVRNIAIGNDSLSKNTTGYTNTLIGHSSGSAQTTAAQNTGVGYESLYLTTTGSNHTAVGLGAGYNILTGVNSVFLGNYAGRNVSQLTSASNSIAIGANTFTTASNQVVIGDANITQTILRGQVTLKGYTVATLPIGITGSIAYVTDALAPTYLGVVVGGGAVTCTVFYNGSSWITC